VSLIRKLFIKGRPCCPAPTGNRGKHCGDPIRIGRFSDGTTCGKHACQLWLNATDYAA
jgi:hypothetical protein